MRRLQTHSHLQPAAKQVAEAQASITRKRRMILHDQPIKAIGALRDRAVVLREELRGDRKNSRCYRA